MKHAILTAGLMASLTGCMAPNTQDPAAITKAQEPRPAQIIEERLAEFLETSQAHGVTIAVTFKGRGHVLHAGTLHPGMPAPATDDTLFEIASVTKTFTGTLAARAVLDGKIGLEDDIRQYLEGEHANLEFAGEPIRFRHLLTHISGLPSNSKGMELALAQSANGDADGQLWRRIYAANAAETRESFLAYLDEVTLTNKPGTHFNYSNYGTNLTAHILERVYAKSYAQLLQEYVFEPAGMRDATLKLSPDQEPRRALGYNERGEAIPRLNIADVLWGADGGVKASASDMLRYMQWQLESGDEAIAQSHRRLDQRDVGYWLGYFWWVIDTENGARSYRHDGGGAGVRNVMILYPEDNLAIYAVTNKTTTQMNGQLTQLVRSIRSDLLRRAQ